MPFQNIISVQTFIKGQLELTAYCFAKNVYQRWVLRYTFKKLISGNISNFDKQKIQTRQVEVTISMVRL